MTTLLYLRQKYCASLREVEAITGIQRTRLHGAETGRITLTKKEEQKIKMSLKKHRRLFALNRIELLKRLVQC